MKRTSDWIWIGAAVLLASPCAEICRGARYKGRELKESGTITGVVRFEGNVPKPKRLKVTVEDKVCHAEPIYSEELVVSKDKKIKWAVASIKKIASGKPFPKGPLSGNVPAARSSDKGPLENTQLDQRGCTFRPHVVLVPARKPLTILNSDGILHNVHTYAKFNKTLNKAMKGNVKKMDVLFKRRERVRLKCDVHKWMSAWIIVAEHPYYAVTGDDGTFRLDNVPPGTHTVEIWHETLGTQKKEVTVKAGEETKLQFVFKRG